MSNQNPEETKEDRLYRLQVENHHEYLKNEVAIIEHDRRTVTEHIDLHRNQVELLTEGLNLVKRQLRECEDTLKDLDQHDKGERQ